MSSEIQTIIQQILNNDKDKRATIESKVNEALLLYDDIDEICRDQGNKPCWRMLDAKENNGEQNVLPLITQEE